ncbi:PTCB-BRCT domain containing protein [Euroglyphus maynei]|uniref:PTCB-BRCT domain containing protein n=1 Tax=Euroglyphus maynei TaxID=6958 RepID=A0A1Y3B0V6_EURMA|nr:PTCB-BRCT domain containing protein [Euroglyphus maynei]
MNVPCLQLKWIYDSFETGHILPFDQYLINTESEKSSTSTNEDNDDDDDDESDCQELCSKAEISDDEYEYDPYMRSIILNENDEEDWKINPPIPTIMFSGFKKEERLHLSKLCNEKISEIIIKDDPVITKELTHLILAEPCGTEKVYAAIAAGAFILKPDYIKDSIEKHKLLTEKEYQWGNGIDDDQIGTSGPKLMKSAIKWNNYLKKIIRQPMFYGHKFLLIFDVTKFDSTMLMSCANILRAGGAKIIHPDELNGVENEEELLQQIDYAIIEWRKEKKFTITKQSLLNYIEYFNQNERLISDIIIYRYIMDGPDVSLTDLMAKYPVEMN